MKDPDTCHDAAVDAVRSEVIAMKLPADETEALIDVRLDKVQIALSKFVEYGEYVGIEFDTDAGTARVLTVKEIAERNV